MYSTKKSCVSTSANFSFVFFNSSEIDGSEVNKLTVGALSSPLVGLESELSMSDWSAAFRHYSSSCTALFFSFAWWNFIFSNVLERSSVMSFRLLVMEPSFGIDTSDFVVRLLRLLDTFPVLSSHSNGNFNMVPCLTRWGSLSRNLLMLIERVQVRRTIKKMISKDFDMAK